MLSSTKGIGTDRYKLMPGVDGKDYSFSVSWSGWREGAFLLNLLFWLLKELRPHVSCQTCTDPVWCALPKPALPLHTMAFVKAVLACSSAEPRQMACLQPTSFVTCWHDGPEGTLLSALQESRVQLAGEGGCCGDMHGSRHHEPPRPELPAEALACSRSCPSNRDSLALSPWLGHITLTAFSLFPFAVVSSSAARATWGEAIPYEASEEGPKAAVPSGATPVPSEGPRPKPLAQITTVLTHESQIRYTGSPAIFKRICVCEWIRSHLEMSPLLTCCGVGPQPYQTYKDP